MLVPFSNLPDESRVWIYQASRPFSNEEKISIVEELETFLKQWAAHGADLVTSYEIPYNRFIVIGLNENLQGATGCSIDSSVHFMQQLEKEFDIDLMNKMNTAFKVGENINIVSLSDFQNFAKEGKITSDTTVFNNMIQSKGDFDSKWEIPAIESWHKRFLAQ